MPRTHASHIIKLIYPFLTPRPTRPRPSCLPFIFLFSFHKLSSRLLTFLHELRPIPANHLVLGQIRQPAPSPYLPSVQIRSCRPVSSRVGQRRGGVDPDEARLPRLHDGAPTSSGGTRVVEEARVLNTLLTNEAARPGAIQALRLSFLYSPSHGGAA